MDHRHHTTTSPTALDNRGERRRRARAVRRRSLAATVIVGISAFGVSFATSGQPAAAFCSSKIVGPLGCDNDADGHEQMNADGLSFLNAGALGEMYDEHEYMDVWGMSASDKHFDNCRFGGSVVEINERWDGDVFEDGVIGEFDPADPSPLDAADEFGQILHVAQDFYAHTNWIDLGRSDLFDEGLGHWAARNAWDPVRDDIVILGEDLPAGWTPGALNGFVPTLTTPTNAPVRALMSGFTLGTSINDECYDPFTVTHGQLNKDNAERTGFAQGRAMAVRQTTHEWCRMLHLLQDEYGPAGPATAMGLWLGNGQSAQAAGTPCAPGPVGSVAVTVSATNLITEDEDDFDDAEANLRLLMLTDDLKQSAMSQSAPAVIDEPQSVPGLSSVTMCVDPTDQLAVSVQGWDDDQEIDGGTSGVFDDEGTDDDDAFAGVTRTLGDAQGAAGTFSGSSDNMDATFTVQVDAGDKDGDGLTACEEIAHGTLVDDADTDNDGLSDGDEVNKYGTSPLDADHDDDGLSDGDEVNKYGTDPKDTDTDNDGLTDGDEVLVYGTDPREGDSDDDGLTDGEELNTYGTDPKLADTDGEGLSDGDEVHVYGTNPREPDTDFDGLDDDIEITYGTNPNAADSDADGLVDGQDVEFVMGAVQSVPAAAFKATGGGSADAMLGSLDAVEHALVDGKEALAVQKLQQLRSHVDGCGTAADNDDWITDCGAQTAVRAMIDLLIANVTN